MTRENEAIARRVQRLYDEASEKAKRLEQELALAVAKREMLEDLLRVEPEEENGNGHEDVAPAAPLMGEHAEHKDPIPRAYARPETPIVALVHRAMAALGCEATAVQIHAQVMADNPGAPIGANQVRTALSSGRATYGFVKRHHGNGNELLWSLPKPSSAAPTVHPAAGPLPIPPAQKPAPSAPPSPPETPPAPDLEDDEDDDGFPGEGCPDDEPMERGYEDGYSGRPPSMDDGEYLKAYEEGKRDKAGFLRKKGISA